MFESSISRAQKGARARFDAHFDQVLIDRDELMAEAAEADGWRGRICAGARVENQAAAAVLMAIGELFTLRLARSAETEDWAIDTMDAVAAEVAADLRISQRLAWSRLRIARAMRERLPQVAATFRAGEVTAHAFETIVSRTDLIEDRDVLARVDKLIALNVGRWPSLTKGRLAGKVDKIVHHADADAVRRRKEQAKSREVYVGDDCDGTAEIHATVHTLDAIAVDQALNNLAATVCPYDPRTKAQRRADAFGSLAVYATRMACQCGRPDCTATKPASPVVIHVIAEQATLDGTSDTPAWQCNADGLITPEVLAELALTATLVPLVHPGYAAPEPNRRPSKALADFVRSRDLTCRWPGCDVPATGCELDHSIPWSQGGPTHAGNINCKCKTHHLLKTFWGWTEKQLPDGTLIFTSPSGDTYVTTPGSALLFPALCDPVGGMPAPDTSPPQDYCGERTAMMPRRRRTRAQDRAHRVATERRHNRAARLAHTPPPPKPPDPDDEPPPF